MPLFDASAIVDLWENYPINQFPSVWDWFEEEIRDQEAVVAEVAFHEIGHKSPDCKKLIQQLGIVRHPIGMAETQHALAIKLALGIQNDEYSTGVDENYIFIISVAKARGLDLVTNEGRQPALPNNPAKYRIPAVCDLPVVTVKTLRLLDYIRQSNRVF